MNKKWLLALIIFFSCLVLGVSDEVFDYEFDDGEIISMYIDEEDCMLTYYDEISAELICVKFDQSELSKIQEIAFECKLIAKKGVNFEFAYNANETFKKISEKLFACGKKRNVSYGEYEGVYLKTTEVITALAEENEKNNTAKSNKTSELTVWVYDNDEIQTIIDKYYSRDVPDVKIDLSITPTNMYQGRLDSAFETKNGAPDVLELDDYFLRKYVEQGDKYLLDLTDVYNEVKDKLIKYPVQIGTYNGKVYALSWQTNSGAMIYRRSLAKKYLGTDDPEEVQKYFSNWENFFNTAVTLNKKSKGKCVVVPSTEDLYKPYLGSRKSPWIVNGELNIDLSMVDYMKMCKKLKDKGLEGEQGQWSEGWFEGMKGTLCNKNGKNVEVFSYFLPRWGLHYVLKPAASDTDGDWAMIPGPSAWSWGGIWIAGYKNTKNPEGVKEFIKYICSDDSFLERWANDTGDIVSNINVIEKVKNSFTESFLNGQNYYEVFAETAIKVDDSLTQSVDNSIEMLWQEQTTAYLAGKITLEEALVNFRDNVKESFDFSKSSL